MGKISMFGISGSGKTCYLYAMAQVLQHGAKEGAFRLSIIANDLEQQTLLNEGYLQMAADGMWPEGSIQTAEFDLCVRVQTGDIFRDIIPSLKLLDYKGGVWTTMSPDAVKDRKELMNAFSESSSVLFLVDGNTLLQAMDDSDLHPSHRGVVSINQKVMARQQISFVENLFMAYKQNSSSIPPVMIVVTKSDVFADTDEFNRGKVLIKDYLPSIFAKGSGIDVGLTAVSLGTNLSHGDGNKIEGHLSLSTQYNIHIPIVYALYAYLSEVYDYSPDNEKREIEHLVAPLQAMMKGRVDMYSNGYPVISV